MGKLYTKQNDHLFMYIRIQLSLVCPLFQDPTIEDTTSPSKKQLIAPFLKLGPHSQDPTIEDINKNKKEIKYSGAAVDITAHYYITVQYMVLYIICVAQ
jgi:hypothetical protein